MLELFVTVKALEQRNKFQRQNIHESAAVHFEQALHLRKQIKFSKWTNYQFFYLNDRSFNFGWRTYYLKQVWTCR